jgi:p-hydroxybenzoate 3-monooxygenase
VPNLRTRVAIVGAGPAGLLLGYLLRAAGIDSIIIERHSLEHILSQVRAGVLEQGSAETLTRLGLGERMAAEGLTSDGIFVQAAGRRHLIDFAALIDRRVTLYGQQEIVRDLVAAHERAGSAIYYDAEAVAVHDVEGAQPRVSFVHGGEAHEIAADFIVGADGAEGVCRRAIPRQAISVADRPYPFAWLGIVADVAPSADASIYALHDDGFALLAPQSQSVSRLYLQVEPHDLVDNFSDARIWQELQQRLATPGWNLAEGPILSKVITPMRSLVASRLNFGSLFLVGDAGHLLPPTGAKGLNAAIGDVTILAAGIAEHYAGSDIRLAGYSREALSRQWMMQQFAQWMTELLHRTPPQSVAEAPAADFNYESQLARIAYIARSAHAQSSLAEQYAGLPS